MNKYIIYWDSGYGKTYDTVIVDTESQAEKEAYESWREEAESQAVYGIECEWDEESGEEFGV